jgi:predicted RecA/RadA family phage recombinase
MTNYIQPGKNIPITAAGAVTSGQLVVTGSLIGVASTSGALGDSIEVATEGVYSLPKITTDDIAAGANLYWASATSNLTKTAGTGSKPLVGIATKAAGNGVTAVECKLTMTGQTGPA